MKRIAMTALMTVVVLTGLVGCRKTVLSWDKLLALPDLMKCRKTVLEWDELPALPDTVGVAGACAGTSGGALIVAGGANFPVGRPWAGGVKVWHDDIFVLEDPLGSWKKIDQKLPRPLAYGVALSGQDAVICLGGGDANQHYADAFMLRWNGATMQVEPLPPMPQPAAFFSGVALGSSIYVAGGRTSPTAKETMHTFWRLDLSKPAGVRQWESLPTWPGRGRMLAVMAVQDGSIFLLSGVDLVPDGSGVKRKYLRDCYRWDEDPKIGWRRIKKARRPMVAAPSPAVEMDPHRVLVLGGDKGKYAGQVESLKDDHPGFPRQISAYLTKCYKWKRYGQMPRDHGPDPAGKPELGVLPAVTTPGVLWRGKIVVPSGEIRPGVRTPRVLWAKPVGWTN